MRHLVRFEAFVKRAPGLTTLEEKQTTAAFIIKVYHDFKQTMIEVNIWRAFRAIGFTHDIDQIPYRLLFEEEKFWQSPGFVELWERDIPLESLPRREARSEKREMKIV
jgi:hypothetical protein